MLTPAERVAFILLAGASFALAARGFHKIYRAVARGRGTPPPLPLILGRAIPVGIDILLQRPIFLARPGVSLAHALIFFAFVFYGLVNILDVAEGFTHLSTLHQGGPVGVYNLIADLLSVGGVAGMVVLLLRRFVKRPFRFNPGVKLLPQVPPGVPRDSRIVGIFIVIHVGSRWVGQALRIAEAARPDPLQPTASLLAAALGGLGEGAITAGIHLTWWLALGLILIFLPYFPYSKHIHLMVAPLNWIVREPRPLGRLEAPTEVDGRAGARHLTDLRWYQLLDAYACIMCHRCQDACPAHGSGAALSPAALEINKRYFLNANLAAVADGRAATPPLAPLLEMAVSKEAVWSCTTCGACVRICPVGNRPMLDVVDIRRSLVNEGDELDANLQSALGNLMRQGNSFGKPGRMRAAWTRDLGFPVKDARKEPVDYLWFVGDYASYDPRAIEVTRAVARVFAAAGVDFGILYDGERNSGNDVRRAGEEGLFEMLAEHNLEQLRGAQFRRIVTTDPHTYNALRFEYPALGAGYEVVHYSEVLADLIRAGKLSFPRRPGRRVTYHDPCYLGRYGKVFDAPRAVLAAAGCEVVEMPRCRENSYCCGAGGGRIWMGGPTYPVEKPAESRIREALALDGVGCLVVACPKDMVMYADAIKTTGSEGRIAALDLIQLVEEALAGGAAARGEAAAAGVVAARGEA